MGMCKRCKEVYNTADMASGYCINCVSSEEFELLKKQDKIVYDEVKESEKHEVKNLSKFVGKTLLSAFMAIFFILILPKIITKNYATQPVLSENYKKLDMLKNELLSLKEKITTLKNGITNKKLALNDKAFDSYFYENQSYTNNYHELSENTQAMIDNYNTLVNQYNIKYKKYKTERTKVTNESVKKIFDGVLKDEK